MNFRVIVLLFSVIFSAVSHSMPEDMTMHIDYGDSTRENSYEIRSPGSDAWLSNGQYHSSKQMPACLEILTDSLSPAQLEQFVSQLDVMTQNTKELSLTFHEGTWAFVDKNPRNSAFVETTYRVQTKNAQTFSEILDQIGAGYPNTRVTVQFDRGCKELAARPFLPDSILK